MKKMAFIVAAGIVMVLACSCSQVKWTASWEGNRVTVSKFAGKFSALEKIQGIGEAESIVFENADFRQSTLPKKFRLENIKTVILKSCTVTNLDFLGMFPGVKAVSSEQTATLFPEDYEIDLSSCENLTFFYMFHMNFNVKFKRIKALPRSMKIFYMPDAIFDMSNLRELQKEGKGKPAFGLSSAARKELAGKKIRFASLQDLSNYNYAYKLGLK